MLTPSLSFTRTSDTAVYASGDLVAQGTSSASVTPLSFQMPARSEEGTYMIRRVHLTTDTNNTGSANFRVHFYNATPTPTNGDNGAWLTTTASYLGACDVTLDKAFSDGAFGVGVPNNGAEINFDPSKGKNSYIMVLIEARAAYVPTANEKFTVTPEIYEK